MGVHVCVFAGLYMDVYICVCVLRVCVCGWVGGVCAVWCVCVCVQYGVYVCVCVGVCVHECGACGVCRVCV